jgi:D-tyrosyl-tRNA(Tyr) deacylase
MRALVQRVSEARVTVGGEVVGQIGSGLCVLVGVTHADGEPEAVKLAERLWHLRIFEDEEGRMNRSAADLGHGLLVISQFTLYAETGRGRRPSFVAAARPDHAEPLVEEVVRGLRALGAPVQTGRFRTEMRVSLVNEGPVTVMVEV